MSLRDFAIESFERALNALIALDPPGYAIGGLSVGEAQEQGVSSTPSFAVTPDGGETKVVDADGLSDAIDDAISQAKG